MKRQFYSFAIASLFFILGLVSLMDAQQVVRGPYLQSQGSNSIVIRWRTDSLTDSRVYYGDTLGAMSLYTDSLTLTTEHRIKLNGLAPLTKYYYSIGSITQVQRGADSLLFFVTAPDSSSHVPVRFWAIGDAGHGSLDQAAVREAYLRYAQKTKPADLQLWLGDNAYSDGTDLEFQNKVFDTVYGYGKLMTYLPFASTSGNHDYNSICPWQDPNGIPVLCNQDPNTHTGPYLNIIDPPTQGELGGVASGKKLFYSMDYGDIHFVFLNSELGSYNSSYNWTGVLNTSQSFTSPMLDWLKSDLAATTKKWKVAIWHQTPYSGQDNFTEENSVQIFCTATRHHFNPIIEQYGVDLVLTGHDHNYQRSYLISGHYGGKTSFTSANMINGSSGNDSLGEAYIKYTSGPLADKGTVYVLEGNSSEANDYSPIDHPAIKYGHVCSTCFGSFIFDVDGDRLDGYYLTSTDSVLDRFTIKKQTWNGIQSVNSTYGDFSISPNPTHNDVFLNYTVGEKGVAQIEILDLTGRLCFQSNLGYKEPGVHRDYIAPPISAGTYILKLFCGGEFLQSKLVKLN